jgi:DNA polymerase III subunit epsilon
MSTATAGPTGIMNVPVSSIPIAIVDVETTGLHARGDRVIEIAVVRLDPGSPPQLAIETLVNPRRPVAATEIHGITDDHVVDAPDFQQLAEPVAAILSGAVFAAYNVYFDVGFVRAELERSGITAMPPHLCLMYLRSCLGFGGRCTLADACRTHRIQRTAEHAAADDAFAAAQLWPVYVARMEDLGIKTFADLARGRSYKFLKSFTSPPIAFVGSQRSPRLKSRRLLSVSPPTDPQVQRRDQLTEYWDALKAALADLDISDRELEYLSEKRSQLGLTVSQIRSLHARAFAGLLANVCDDHAIEDVEVDRLAQMASGLRRLGWSPGDPATAGEKRGLISRLFAR